MSELESLVAQTLLLGFEGETINDVTEQLTPLIELGIAGFILFSHCFKQRLQKKNIIDFEQTKNLIGGLQAINRTYHELPVLMAIDYEGGNVDRLMHLHGGPVTASSRQSASFSETCFHQQAQAMANFCFQLGFNFNLAPVVDLALSNGQGIINASERSYGTNPQQVSHLAWQFMQPFLKLSIACCLKHFPGHGSTSGDTHHDVVDVTKNYHLEELMPFHRLLRNQHPLVTVMTAHIINQQLDPCGLPATLSKVMLSEQLRHSWQYEGVIVSDDLQMLALARNYSLHERLAMALNAGCDLLIIGNQVSYDDPMEIIDTMVSLVNNGDIPLSRLKQAASRVGKLKQHINHSSRAKNG